MKSSTSNASIIENMNLGGIDIMVVKKDIKNMHLSVLPPDGKVRITTPVSTKDETIRLFALTKLTWMKAQIAKFEHQPRQTEREYVTGESHYFWGKRYRLQVAYAAKANSLQFVGNTAILTVREGSKAKQLESFLNEWYRTELKQRIPSLIEHWEKILGVKVKDYGVKNMRTRWGTCNASAARVWINLQLAKKPPKCLEYIVLHEMLHLIEKTHGKEFVALMDMHMPDWRTTKEMLNGFVLDEYDGITHIVDDDDE